MKFKDIILVILIGIFIFIFKENNLIRNSIYDGVIIWFKYIVCSLLPIYFIVDLMLNYGITDFIKNNKVILVILSFLLGAPSNAKYIDEFLKKKLISIDDAKHLLFSIYSPSILFILGLNYYSYKLIVIIIFLDLIMYFISKSFFIKSKDKKKAYTYPRKEFTKVIEESTKKSFEILILILGIISFYKIIIALVSSLNIDFLSYFIELTSACDIVIKNDLGIFTMLLCLLFGGVSVHTQVKSINSDLYKYFLYGRIISTIPSLILLFV